jgi:16S rRNA U516 pseudouridylate synthase RsuA-like enzyme
VPFDYYDETKKIALRQIRRVLEAVGSRVLKLVRTRIGGVEIGGWRSGSIAC